MPTRPNPYYSGNSSATYGSRGIAPSVVGGMGNVPTALAQMVATLVDAGTYDPNTDPRATRAMLDRIEARDAEDAYTGRQTVAAALERGDNFGQFMPGAVRSGMKPTDVAGLGQLAAAAVPDLTADTYYTPERQDRLFFGAGGSPSAGFNRDRYKPTNVMVGGEPQIVAQQDAINGRMAPVLNKSEVEGSMLADIAASLTPEQTRQVVGANPPVRTPYNYSGPNGSGSTLDPSSVAGPGTMIYTGQATGTPDQLRPTVLGNLQEQNIANQKFGNLIDFASEIAMRDPTVFGVTGNVRRFAQNIGQQVANAQQLSPGSGLPEAFADAQQRAAASGVQLLNPLQYDPNLSDIVTVSELLVFGAAETLASQQGRSVSDRDVQLFRSIVGDPTAWASSQEQFMSKMGLIKQVLNLNQGVIDQSLGSVAAGAVGPQAPQPAGAPEAELPPGAKLLPDGRAQMPDGTILRWEP